MTIRDVAGLRRIALLLFFVSVLPAAPARASAFGTVRGAVLDQSDRAIQGVAVTITAVSSAWHATTKTDARGTFEFALVPIGDYSVNVAATGFAPATQAVTVIADSTSALRLRLSIAPATAMVTVAAAAPTDSPTPVTLISREDIARTPGAGRANSLAMITDFVPGAYMTHDMLHIRGGHQTSWLIDGVPVINTAIAENVGPQFAPGDIDYLEVSRGSYGAEQGDRTYGVFNVAPRTGFESNNDANISVTAGNFRQTDDHVSFGGHTNRFAYYTSLSGNRSDLGLETPVSQTVHDAENGVGGFGSFIFNADGANQIRVITSARRDAYQIPYDPDPNDIENGAIAANDFSPQWQSAGLRDTQRETDAGVILSWVHTFTPNAVMTLSPFYHDNRGDYASSPADEPVATTENRASVYAGAQVSVAATLPRQSLNVGALMFHQRDTQVFGAVFNDGSGAAPVMDTEQPSANLETFFIDDKIAIGHGATMSIGVRPTHFAGSGNDAVSESAISPRVGGTYTVPHLGWTARAFYGRYYQAPPLESVSGAALVDLASDQGLAFVPLHGESDRERQIGVTIPVRGWVIDADHFQTDVTNFLDHNNIGDSSIFFPLTISAARIRASEVTLRSPRFAHGGQCHLAYSYQTALGSGTITGGLTDFTVLPDLSPLDHDQRNTLSVGGDVSLRWKSYVSANVSYGSGFVNGLPGQPYSGGYLPSHTTIDLAAGKDLGKNGAVSINALNVTNQRVELDNSLTFGGFHWNAPREIFVRINYRLHY